MPRPRCCCWPMPLGAATSLAAGAAGRRPRLRGDEAVARRRRMDPPRPGRGGAGRRRAIALGLDTGLLTRVSLAGTDVDSSSRLLDRASACSRDDAQTMRRPAGTPTCRSKAHLPPLTGAVDWLNSPPLTREQLQGKVVLVDFWTYSCINCLRAIPYVRAWAEKYKDQGLVVIGVHAPEFAFEQNVDNVRKAVADLEHRLSGGDRQQLRDLAGLQQPILAGALLHRCPGPDPPPPFRRRRLRRVRAGDPAAAGRGRARRCRRAGWSRSSATGVRGGRGRRTTSSRPRPMSAMPQAENFVSPGGAVPNASHVYERRHAAAEPMGPGRRLDGRRRACRR